MRSKSLVGGQWDASFYGYRAKEKFNFEDNC